MADQGTKEAEHIKQNAERSAKVVLAKHPCVVAGTTHPTPAERDALSRDVGTGTRNIARGLQR